MAYGLRVTEVPREQRLAREKNFTKMGHKCVGIRASKRSLTDFEVRVRVRKRRKRKRKEEKEEREEEEKVKRKKGNVAVVTKLRVVKYHGSFVITII